MKLASSQSWLRVYVPEDKYFVYQCGSHADGSYVRVYVPEAAGQPGENLKALLYLHGFALCMPSFYEDHLVDLVKEGYIVFFPDFQRSFYPNTPPQESTFPRSPLAHFQTWLSVATQSSAQNSFSTCDVSSMLSAVYERGDVDLGRGLSEFSPREFRGVARALVIIIGLLNVFSWFRKEYGKNLIHLLSTVGLSLVHRPTQWLNNVIALTEDAWEYLSQQECYSHWNQETLDTFAFGHSLGGLFALSLPFCLKDSSNHRFFPKQIVTADPAPSTEIGIPRFAIWILKLFRSPFTEAPIRIQDTGTVLTKPVVILHGGADRLVPPHQWVVSSANYKAIASQHKAIYFSYSNSKKQPPLVAFHNQAVTSTQYYDDALFKNFGGVKNGPNAYNAQYIWPSVRQLFAETTPPEDLLSHLNIVDFQVKTTPPDDLPKFPTILVSIVGSILLLGVGYWIWKVIG